jgi:hypothetical protein
MNTKPLTPAEAKSEYEYRLKERLGMMSPDTVPTEEQQVFAQSEATREVGLLKKALLQ